MLIQTKGVRLYTKSEVPASRRHPCPTLSGLSKHNVRSTTSHGTSLRTAIIQSILSPRPSLLFLMVVCSLNDRHSRLYPISASQ
jgi:hypothetical protein